MNYIQAEAWAIDRALEIYRIDGKAPSTKDLIKTAKELAKHMHEVVEKSGQLDDEMQQAIDAQVEKRLFEMEVSRIEEERKNGTTQ